MEMTVFKPSRMEMFARLVSMELGVKVKLKGREICVNYGPPPLIYLPNMEYATEADVDALRGFCLHEAGHVAYSNFKLYSEIDTYLLKVTQNWLEDEYMERMLEKDFPGARSMLLCSYTKGRARFEKEFGAGADYSKTYLGEDGKALAIERIKTGMNAPKGTPEADVLTVAKAAGMDWTDAATLEKVQKRFEFERACRLWFTEARRYPFPSHDWGTHPWRQTFDEVTGIKAKSTRHTLDQSKELIARLGIDPCLPNDKRPIKEAEVKASEAEERIEALREAARALRKKLSEINKKIADRTDATLENQKLLEARDAEREAHEDAREASKRLADTRKKLKDAKEMEKITKERLAKMRKKAREVRESAKGAEGELKDMLENEIERLKERIAKAEATLEKRAQRTEELKNAEDKELEDSLGAKSKEANAKVETALAEDELAKEGAKIKAEEDEAGKGEVAPLEAAEAAAKAEADKAIKEANDIGEGIKARDGEIEEPIAPGVMKGVIAAAYEEYRDQDLGDELKDALGAEPEADKPEAPEGASPDDVKGRLTGVGGRNPISDDARKYTPYDRDNDTIDRVVESPEGRQKYETARAEYAKVIEESTEKLRKLYSPEKVKLKVNVEQGRINPREAYKIGMACKKVPVDISKVYKTVTVRKDPKVAVSLLLDCSGSMTMAGPSGKSNFQVAKEAACCLSEVLRNLNIPHEIIGHTTRSSAVEGMIRRGEIDPADEGHFSRFAPFRGYLFKSFEERVPPTTLFSNVTMEDNLDGEALLWSVSRLGARKEKTKICISISDGLPLAHMSSRQELERHLYSMCKQIEAREKDGLFLYGVGIGEKMVEKFFKHSHVLNDVDGLPACVLGIVEHVLIKLVGTMG